MKKLALLAAVACVALLGLVLFQPGREDYVLFRSDIEDIVFLQEESVAVSQNENKVTILQTTWNTRRRIFEICIDTPGLKALSFEDIPQYITGFTLDGVESGFRVSEVGYGLEQYRVLFLDSPLPGQIVGMTILGKTFQWIIPE